MTIMFIIALRNEKGSYNAAARKDETSPIIALRNEKGSYNIFGSILICKYIIALRNEKGSYNQWLGGSA